MDLACMMGNLDTANLILEHFANRMILNNEEIHREMGNIG